MVSKGIMVKNNKTVGTDLRFTICSYQENDEVWFDTFNKNINLQLNIGKFKVNVLENTFTDKKMRDFCHQFFLNFLNFLHNPEVEYLLNTRSETNIERRIKQGKPIIPASAVIKLSGYLKQYVETLTAHSGFTHNYRFWVRGHFRELRAEKWKQKRGQRIWIPPFLKGNGIIFQKPYELKSENHEVKKLKIPCVVCKKGIENPDTDSVTCSSECRKAR